MISTRLTGIIVGAVAVLTTAFQSHALDTNYYAESSRLASGHWVKIKVTQNGIQEVTEAQLREWGFSNPRNVAVYGYGGTALVNNNFSVNDPDDIKPVLTYYSSTYKKLCFYGQSDLSARLMTNTSLDVKRNAYATAGYYFLTEDAPKAVESYITLHSSSSSCQTTHTSLVYIENDVQNPATAGTFYFDKSLLEGNKYDYKFPYRDLRLTNGASFKGNILYSFAASNRSTLLGLNSLNEDVTLGTGSAATIAQDKVSRTFYVSSLGYAPISWGNSATSGELGIRVGLSANLSESLVNSLSFAALDKIALVYPRSNDMDGVAQLAMFFPNVNGNKTDFRIYNMPSEGQVWNIYNPYNVRMHMSSKSGTSVICSLDNKSYDAVSGAASVIAFNPAMTLHQVELVDKNVKNQNLHAHAVPDMIIVANPSMVTQAERLADIHRQYQGFTVNVVTPEQLYNEFSSGTPSPMGIKRYVKMCYDRNPEKMRHLLFMGVGTWDNRHILIPDNDHMITYQTELFEPASVYTSCYTSDSYFAMLDDKYNNQSIKKGVMQINVGRLPVANAGAASTVIDKIEDFFKNPPVYGSYNHALLFCDDGDSNDHLNQSDFVADIFHENSPNITITKAYNALYPWNSRREPEVMKDMMKQTLARGVSYLGYAGHGRTDRLGYDEALWDLPTINNTNYSVLPFTMLSTCGVFIFDREGNDFTTTLINKVGGGALNVVGACRSVYKELNQAFNVEVARAYSSAGAGSTSGDVFREAHNAVLATADPELAYNTLCYNLAGDPAIPIPVPTLKVKTLTVDGIDVSDPEAEVVNVYPLKPFTITGAITDSEGNIQSDYNGTLTIEVFDGAYQVMSSDKGEGAGGPTKLVDIDETTVAQVRASVVNGHFEATVTTPVIIHPENVNRVTYYATNSTHSVFAADTFMGMNIQDYDADQASDDTTAPVITAFYLNDESFVSGDEVGSSPTAYAEIAADATGFNMSSSSVGGGAKLILDGGSNFTYIASAVNVNADGSASVSFGLNDLADGNHTLEFSIADNMGNRSSRTLTFTVVNRSATCDLALEETTVRTEANFSLSNSTFHNEPTGRLVIEDTHGNAVFSRENCSFPYTWNLRDANNNLVDDGHYTAYVVLRSGLQFGNTSRIPLVIVK